jgi:hypothetical protein
MLQPPPVVAPLLLLAAPLLPELLWPEPLLLALASPVLPEKNVSGVPPQAQAKAAPTAPSEIQEARFTFMWASPEGKSVVRAGKISRRWWKKCGPRLHAPDGRSRDGLSHLRAHPARFASRRRRIVPRSPAGASVAHPTGESPEACHRTTFR